MFSHSVHVRVTRSCSIAYSFTRLNAILFALSRVIGPPKRVVVRINLPVRITIWL